MKEMKKVLKQTLAFVLVVAMLAGVIPTAYVDNAVTAEAAEAGRQVVNISKEWKFYKGKADNAQKTDFNDSKWETINIPHTWNVEDGTNGGDYYKGDGWYRKKLPWDDAYNNKRVFIEFLGANKQADVYVNGTHKGNHKGGYTCFRYDITNDLKKNQDNIIAVKINNENHHAIAPRSGDFTFYGGIYREVSLVLTDPVHVNTMDYGSSGLKLTTKNVSKQSAELNIKTTIRNDSDKKKDVKVKAVLKHPDSFEEVEGIEPEFDVTKMYGGGVVKEVEQTISVDAGKTADFSKDIKVDSPHLWNGKKDPYRYQVDLTVTVDGQVVDNVTEYVGFRSFKVDIDKGFILNGESYPLRGVCRHQDREGLGSALTKKEHDEDFKIMYDIGANTVRLAHYPHASYFYELCDKYGIVVWAEIPFVNEPANTSAYNKQDSKQKEFVEVTRQQMIEMIRQQYNHPSIVFWGLQNEVKEKYDDFMKGFMPELNELAHKEDPTGRLTTQATDKDKAYNWESDLMAWNRYPGSYSSGSLGGHLDNYYKKDKRPVGISEYGVASSPFSEHVDEPGGWVNNDRQDEEFANKKHEEFIKDINEREYIWGTYLWNLFDFGADHRKEGGLMGINTKGLVTFDRKTFKDVFYLYKAYWNPDPFVYITSRRYEKRKKDKISVKIYSNCDNVTLTVNGKKIGELKQSQLKQENVFIWDNVVLDRASNMVEVTGTKNGKTFKDSCIWKLSGGDDASIYSVDLPISGKDKTIQLAKDVEISKIEEVIQTDADKVIGVYKQDNGKLIYQTEGKVEEGMVLAVFADEGKTAEYYTFIQGSYTLKKDVTATSEENKTGAENVAKNAVDGNSVTRWAASSTSYPQSITVDMGEKKNLKNVRISWFVKGDRAYKYKVSVSDKKDSGYKQIIDRSNNTQAGVITDTVNASGRYLKVEVTGASSSGNASIYEIEAFGEQPKIYNSDKINVDKLPAAITENSDEPQEGMQMHRIDVESGTISGTTREEHSEDAGVKYDYLNLKEGDELNGKVSFKVACDKAGNRKMRIYYCHQFVTGLKISLNGKELKSMEVPTTAAFFGLGIDPLRITLPLVEGTNEIVLEGIADKDAPWMDYFNIELTQGEIDKTKELAANPPTDEPPAGNTPETGTTYEAEKATLTDACQIVEGANSSDGKHVTEIGGSKGGQATFAVEAEKAGKYTLDIHYITQATRDFEVTVNDGTPTVVNCAGNNTDWDKTVEKATIEVQLNEGANTIILGNKADYAPNLDRIVLDFKEEVIIPDVTDEEVAKLKAELESTVETAKSLITSGEQVYTAETWEIFEAAYNAAVEVKEDADAETLTKLTTELKTAMSGLKKNGEVEPDPEVEIAVQKEVLTTVMNGAKSTYEKDQDKYTEESWAVFKEAYENAEKEMNNGDTSPDALKKCQEALTAAQKALVEKTQEPVVPAPTPDDEELEAAQKEATEAFEEAAEIYESDSKEYTEESWSEFEAAYQAMEDALADEDVTADTLTKCTEDLKDAKEALVKKDTTPDPDTNQNPNPNPNPNPTHGTNPGTTTTPQYMSGVQVTADKAELYYGGNVDNTATVKVSLPTGAASQSITYSTSNERIARVDAAGRITAVGKGDVVITAKVTLTTGESKDFSLNVAVKKAYIEKVKVKASYKVGKKATLKAKAYGSDEKITWKIKSGARYARITKAGKLTARAKGKVKVTAKSGKISKTFTIRIK